MAYPEEQPGSRVTFSDGELYDNDPLDFGMPPEIHEAISGILESIEGIEDDDVRLATTVFLAKLADLRLSAEMQRQQKG